MPTIIAIDVSLSMCRPIGRSKGVSEDDILTRKKLAVNAVNQFLDHLNMNCKLEYVSLMTFSHESQVLVPFTRDFENIRSQLANLAEQDRTNYENLFDDISAIVLDHWGSTVPVQIFIITDGSPGYGPGCLKGTVHSAKRFAFPAKMNIFSISDPEEKNYSENCQMLQQLIEATCGDGVVYFPENHLSSKGCTSAVARLCAKDFTPYKGTLRCGQLSSKITLCPPPQPYLDRSEEKRCEISETIEIIGFITNTDLASPAAHSRHLILPCRSAESGFTSIKSESEDHSEADGAAPNFCVLLHGAMKVDNISAIVEAGENWFGFIFSWADTKKKSNLMLSLLPPGNDVVPWLGNLQEVGSKEELVNRLNSKFSNPTASSSGIIIPSFPVKSSEKRSYASNPTVWTTPGGINSDIQKLLRHARKLPEKTPQFFKELNRMRRWALTIGFTDILETMAQILERECMTLNSAQPEAVMQLSHAANQLRAKLVYTKNITPHKP